MIYLDYQATTPVAPEVFAAMEPWLKENFWNPHSAHAGGRKAAAAVEAARAQVAALLPKGGKLIFTSGATEAINLAIKGSGLPVSAYATEHAAVLDCVALSGGDIDPVRNDGMYMATPICAIAVWLVAMLVNNEIGTIQPIAEIASTVHADGGLLLM